MNGDELIIHVARNHYEGKFEFYVMLKNVISGMRAVSDPVVFQKVDEGTCYKQPCFTVSDDQVHTLQVLLDDLWNLGLRPTNVKLDHDLLDSKDSHIKDLRAIAFHKLGIK